VVVPTALKSLITMYNAKELLQHGTYVTFDEKRKTNPTKEHLLVIDHKNSKGAIVKYHIIDDTRKLTSTDWDRVAAVFVSGALWQFDDWPIKNPPQIFANFRGFHLMWEDEKLNPTIQGWNVHILTLKRSHEKRYLDRTAMLKFWTLLEDFLAHKKPYLTF